MGTAVETKLNLNLGAITSPNPQGGKDLLSFTRDVGWIARPMQPSIRRVFTNAVHGEPIDASADDEANRGLFEAISAFYGLAERSLDPQTYFQTRMHNAHNHVVRLLDTFCPTEARIHNMYPQMAPPGSPAELISRLNSPIVSERDKYETRRTTGLALIDAQIETAANGHEDKLDDTLDNIIGIIASSLTRGETKSVDKKVYSLHDNTTNQVLWANGIYKTPKPKRITNAHVKEHDMQMWDIEGIGDVSISPRIKQDASLKAIRRAIERSQETGHDTTLDPLADVKDVAGIQFVVAEAFSSNDAKVAALMEKVKDSLIECFGPEVKFETKNGSHGSPSQSLKFDKQRFMVTIPKYKIRIEFMFHGLGMHLNNNFDIGSVDPKTGQPSGPAHDIMAVERDLTVLDALFPQHRGPYHSLPLQEIKKRSYHRVVDRLLMGDERIPEYKQRETMKKLGLIK